MKNRRKFLKKALGLVGAMALAKTSARMHFRGWQFLIIWPTRKLIKNTPRT